MKRFTQIFFLLIATLIFLPGFTARVHADPTFSTDSGSQGIIYCNDPAQCSIDKGTEIVKDNINDIEKNRNFSVYVQDVMNYVLAFVAIIGVIMIIFAGFQILTAGSDEKKVGSSKTMIMYVAIGMLIMFLAWSIVSFIIKVTEASKTAFQLPNIIPETMAYGAYDTNTFDEYKQKIEALTSQLERDYKLNGRLSDSNLSDLQRYTTMAISTFAEDDNYNFNTSIGQNLLISIDYVRKNPGSDNGITDLAKNINDFLNKTKVKRITGNITLTPQTGNAPLSVTFHAENVIDPSGVTIPNTNFIWSIRGANNTNTIIGTGPSVMYKFTNERNYTVNLDIISASRNSNGKIDTLPFNGKTIVNVLPRAGTIYMYINGVSVSNLDRLKITPAIGRAGVLIDASSSLPANGSQFTQTTWDFGNGVTKYYDGAPKFERQIFAQEGSYHIQLKLLTNENKEVIKDLQLDVINPIASILASKITGFSKEDFKFQASTFFAAGQLQYEWDITDLAAGKVVYSQTTPNITYKFPRSGKYAVKLKTDDAAGREDIDTVIVSIESRDPVAKFSSSVEHPETPNIFTFDATSSYDPDAGDASQLNFNWMIDGQSVDLENPSRNGALGTYTFNTLGVHNITLNVSNPDGKIATVKNTVTVDSLLSVKLRLAQRIVQNGTSANFIAESSEAKTFEWNFGDGGTDITSDGRASHTYKKSGTYNVVLTVRGADTLSSNSITRKIYVTDSDQPFALITIKKNNTEVEETPDACNGESAYVLDRANIVTLSAENSINVDGTTTGLNYTWKYTDKNSDQKFFTYKFDELGCFPIDLSVRSQKNGKVSSMRSYVRIDNIPPKLSGITIVPTDTNADPVIVKVSANNARDDDGVIVSYLWYYYTDNDPEPQDFRISRLPSTTFVLPKITGKYYFAVTIEDSDGAKVNSDASYDERYSLTLAGDNINTPILSLKTSNTAIFVGDATSFDVTAKNILGTDISDKCEYKWDFDGDGFYDETTTSPKITHVYKSPGTFNFKVKVTYKGMSNTKYQQIAVHNQLKPQFDYIAIGQKLILFNTTKGFYTQANWDLGNGISSTNIDTYSYDFTNSTFPSIVSLTVSDGDKTTQTISLPVRKDIVNKLRSEKSSDQLIYFTYPQTEDGIVHISSPDEKLFVYLGESKGNIKRYGIDTNTEIDSDLDGIKDNDIDNVGTDSERTGAPYAISDWDQKVKQRTIRMTLYGENNTVIASKDIQIVLDFADASMTASGAVDTKNNMNISDEDKVTMEEIKNEISGLSPSLKPKMMDYLAQLQDSWSDEREKTKIIIDFESYIEQNLAGQKQLQTQLFSQLESFLVTQQNNKDAVSIAAQVLKNLAKPSKSYDAIVKDMDGILSHPNDYVKNKVLGEDILKLIEGDPDIPNDDKLLIKDQIKSIINAGAPKETQIPVAPVSTDSSGGVLGFLIGFVKILGYMLLGIIGLVILAFLYYKISKKNDNLSFQDFIIEKFSGSGPSEIPSVQPMETSFPKTPDVPKPEPKDVLQDIFTRSTNLEMTNTSVEKFPENTEISSSSQTPEITPQEESHDVPDWLKGSATIQAETSLDDPVQSSEAEASVEEVNAPAADIPDWLKGGEAFATPTPEPKKDDIPDWLKGMNSEEINAEVEETLSNPSISGTPSQKEKTEISNLPILESSPLNQDEDVPEWLRGSIVSSEAEPTESQEIKQTSQNEESQDDELENEESTSPFEIEEVGTEPKKKSIKKSTKKPAPKTKKIESTPKLTPDVPNANSGDLPEWLK